MSDRTEGRRQGAALLIVLAVGVLVGSLTLLALHAAVDRARLVGDARWRVEGQLVAATALAAVRVGRRALIDSIADGAVVSIPSTVRVDGWTWHADVMRAGALIRLIAVAERRASDGTLWAVRRASLMLARGPADTVRVLGTQARF